jgi:hypothetical protein
VNIHKRSSFDDMSIGRLGHSGRTIKGRLVDRPSGLTTKDWYALARGREGRCSRRPVDGEGRPENKG